MATRSRTGNLKSVGIIALAITAITTADASPRTSTNYTITTSPPFLAHLQDDQPQDDANSSADQKLVVRMSH